MEARLSTVSTRSTFGERRSKAEAVRRGRKVDVDPLWVLVRDLRETDMDRSPVSVSDHKSNGVEHPQIRYCESIGLAVDDLEAKQSGPEETAGRAAVDRGRFVMVSWSIALYSF